MSVIAGSGPSVVSAQSHIWDTGLLAWVVWDGSLTTTAVNIGNVTVASSALPTGASTAANQTTGNSSLASIDGKIEALDLANSDPVVVAVVDGSGDQITSFSGTEYTEGAVDTTITGTAILWEDTSDTLRAVSAAKPLPVDGSGVTQPVTQSDTSASGSLSAPGSVSLALDGFSVVGVQVTGTWTGSLSFEGTVDNTTYVSLNGFSGSGVISSITTVNGLWFIGVAGLQSVRVRATALSSGTAVITIRAGAGHLPVFLGSVDTNDPSPSQHGLTTFSLLYAQSVSGLWDALGANGQANWLSVWDSATVQQATATASQVGTLIQGAVTTSAPSYTTGNTNPLSLRTNGHLRVDSRYPLTASAPAAATVGTSSGQAVASNTGRLGLVLVNTSSARISLGFGQTAVLDSGITLMPNGGTFVMDTMLFSTAAVNAIASAASSNLAIQEYS